jgi:TRAP-type mannitol/chloroaromatic compound transport system permease small subunit
VTQVVTSESRAASSGKPLAAAYRAFETAVHGASRLCGILATLCLLVLVCAAVADVAMREVEDRSLAGAVEVSTLALVMVAFLGLPYAERTRSHVRTGLLADRVRPRLSAAFEAIGGLAVGTLFTWMAYETFQRALRSLDTNEVLSGLVRVAVWPARVVISIGLALLVLEIVLNVVDKTAVALGRVSPNRRTSTGPEEFPT